MLDCVVILVSVYLSVSLCTVVVTDIRLLTESCVNGVLVQCAL